MSNQEVFQEAVTGQDTNRAVNGEEGVIVTADTSKIEEGGVLYKIEANTEKKYGFAQNVEITFGLSVLTAPGDYMNSFETRRGWLDYGDLLYMRGWIKIEKDHARHRSRNIERAFCITSQHKVAMTNQLHSIYYREGLGTTCYIIEDVSFIPKSRRGIIAGKDFKNITYNVDEDYGAKKRSDFLEFTQTAPAGGVCAEDHHRFTVGHMELVKSFIKLKLDKDVPVAGWYPYNHLISSVDHFNSKRTSTVCTEGVCLEFDYRAAMYYIGFVTAKLFSDDNFEFTEIFNTVPELNRTVKDFNTFGRGEFLATLAIGDSLSAAINLRILVKCGIHTIHLHGAEVAATLENVTVNKLLRAITFMKDSIMFTAHELGCETEHELAFCRGMHSAWHLHAHTDEGGWIRVAHSYVKLPPSRGYLKRHPRATQIENTMKGTWLQEMGKTLIDKYLCYAYCSTIADPGMSINGYRIPLIAIRRDFDAEYGEITNEQFMRAMVNNDTRDITKKAKLEDFSTAEEWFCVWARNIKYLYATCMNISCGMSDNWLTYDTTIMTKVQKHFSQKASIMPFWWVEPSGIAFYVHQYMTVMPVYSIYSHTHLEFMENIRNVGYAKLAHIDYDYMAAGEHLALQLGPHTPRNCGAHYILSSAYNRSNGLCASAYCKIDSSGQKMELLNKVIYARTNMENSASMRWVIPHSTIPHPAECLFYFEDNLWHYMHTPKVKKMPAIGAFMRGAVKIKIVACVPTAGYWDAGVEGKTHRYINRSIWNTVKTKLKEPVVIDTVEGPNAIVWANKQSTFEQFLHKGDNRYVSSGTEPAFEAPERSVFRPIGYGKSEQQAAIKYVETVKTGNKLDEGINLGREMISSQFRRGDIAPEPSLNDLYEITNVRPTLPPTTHDTNITERSGTGFLLQDEGQQASIHQFDPRIVAQANAMMAGGKNIPRSEPSGVKGQKPLRPGEVLPHLGKISQVSGRNVVVGSTETLSEYFASKPTDESFTSTSSAGNVGPGFAGTEQEAYKYSDTMTGKPDITQDLSQLEKYAMDPNIIRNKQEDGSLAPIDNKSYSAVLDGARYIKDMSNCLRKGDMDDFKMAYTINKTSKLMEKANKYKDKFTNTNMFDSISKLNHNDLVHHCEDILARKSSSCHGSKVANNP